MKKNKLLIIGGVVVLAVAGYYFYNKSKTVVAKNQDGSEKKAIKTKSGKDTTTVNSKGDYIDGSSLYDASGKVIAMISNDATDTNGTAKAVFVDEDGAFIAAPDGSLLFSNDGVTYTSPDKTVYLNQP